MNLVAYNGQLVTSNGNAITTDLASMLPSGIGVVDLGECNWTYYPNNSIFRAQIIGKAQNYDMVCTKYLVTASGWSAMQDKHMKIYYSTSDDVAIKDTDYTDAQSFKQGNAGQLLFYRKAT